MKEDVGYEGFLPTFYEVETEGSEDKDELKDPKTTN